jgi:hypothetical protein
MTFRSAGLLVSLLTACGSPQKPAAANGAGQLPPGGFEPARFAWRAPLTVHVSEQATKDSRSATLSYWLDVCPKAPDQLLLTHRDFHFVEVMGKPASSPEFAPALAELEPIMSAIPRFVIDAHGAVVSVEGVEELIARLRNALPSSALDELRKTLESPTAMQALTERWQLWVRAWLDFDPHQISARDVVGPHRVKLTRKAQEKDLPDPTGSGAKIEVDVVLETDTEWPEIRPFTASSQKTVHVSLDGQAATRSETHRYTFDWGAHPEAKPDCAASSVP